MTTDLSIDAYADSAEFYDVMAAPHWAVKRHVLVSALEAAGHVESPLLDIGAGSGLSTVALADTIADLPIHVVEPSAAMRAALMSRIMARADLRNRVTLHADILENVALPDRIGAVVAFGVIGYLARPVRERLWQQLSERLDPGAPVVVEVMPLSVPLPVPEMTIAREQVGEHDTEVRISGVPADDESERWTMRYLVRRGEVQVRDFTVEHVWRTVGLDELGQEAGRFGLTCDRLTQTIATLRKV